MTYKLSDFALAVLVGALFFAAYLFAANAHGESPPNTNWNAADCIGLGQLLNFTAGAKSHGVPLEELLALVESSVIGSKAEQEDAEYILRTVRRIYNKPTKEEAGEIYKECLANVPKEGGI